MNAELVRYVLWNKDNGLPSLTPPSFISTSSFSSARLTGIVDGPAWVGVPGGPDVALVRLGKPLKIRPEGAQVGGSW